MKCSFWYFRNATSYTDDWIFMFHSVASLTSWPWPYSYIGFGFILNKSHFRLKKKCLISDSCTILSRTCTAWIGGNDIETEGQFVWDKSNTKIGFSNWSPGNPSIDFPDQAPTRDCVDLYRDGKWNDRRCTYLNPFICEKLL